MAKGRGHACEDGTSYAANANPRAVEPETLLRLANFALARDVQTAPHVPSDIDDFEEYAKQVCADIAEGENVQFQIHPGMNNLAMVLARHAYEQGAAHVDLRFHHPIHGHTGDEDLYRAIGVNHKILIPTFPDTTALQNSAMTPEEQKRYAASLVGSALNVREGAPLVIQAPPESYALVQELARSAYERGAQSVDVVWNDPRFERLRLDHAKNMYGVFAMTEEGEPIHKDHWKGIIYDRAVLENASYLQIDNNSGLGVTDNLDMHDDKKLDAWDETKVAWSSSLRDHSIRNNEVPWVIAHDASEVWADKVYPDLPKSERKRALAADLLDFARCNENDGPNGLKEHLTELHTRSDRLNELDIQELEFSGGGTSLRVGIAKDTRWLPVQWEANNGNLFAANIPSEEIFTTPNPESVTGIVKCTKPLVYAGRTATGITQVFENGKLVDVTCNEKENEGWLRDLLFHTDGMNRMGEIAIVPADSRVALRDRIYYNGILDENSVSHYGMGNAHDIATKPGQPHPGNQSRSHVDFMLGSKDQDVYGYDKNGQRHLILQKGQWANP